MGRWMDEMMGFWEMGRWVSRWRGGVRVGCHYRQYLSQLIFNVFKGQTLWGQGFLDVVTPKGI